MKTLTAMVVLIGMCFLSRPVYVQSVHVAGADDYECVGAADGRTVSPGTLQRCIYQIEHRLGIVEIQASNIRTLELGEDDLKSDINELKNTVASQGTLLDAQRQQIEDLRKQIDMIRAEPTKKPRKDANKAKEAETRP